MERSVTLVHVHRHKHKSKTIPKDFIRNCIRFVSSVDFSVILSLWYAAYMNKKVAASRTENAASVSFEFKVFFSGLFRKLSQCQANERI